MGPAAYKQPIYAFLVAAVGEEEERHADAALLRFRPSAAVRAPTKRTR